ncbi:MAG: Gmad2 immunoglobulin-like domain-containing protein, partial [Candidatus Veblenbacteria bacterium]|nr:Gmad2 immunoglobulin-like domain-containing protein [Candidatus Veblenbacteria bacterium]
CAVPGGASFTEYIGNEMEKQDLIRVENPRPNQVIASPLTERGEARGTWYFEASFPVRLLDANGTELAVAPAQAQGDWMTTEFVPFEVVLSFSPPATPTGVLVLEKDNPSGLPENADSLLVPVRFTP